MRVAPPVRALSCSAGPWQSMQWTLPALSLSVAAWWAGAHLWGHGAWLVGGSLGLGLVAAVLARRTLATPDQHLGWDGSQWRLQWPGSDSQAGRVALMLDLGGWMLVRFTPEAAGRAGRGRVWLPLWRRDAAADWQLLRVALYAPQPASPAS